MTDFQLSPVVDKRKIFLVQCSELEGRFDPHFYEHELKQTKDKILSSKHGRIGQLSFPIQNGSTPTGGKFSKTGVPYYRSQDFDLFEIKNNQFVTSEFHSKLKRSAVRKGDVLVAVVGATLGKVGYIASTNQEGNINQNVARIRVKHESLMSKYLSIYLYTNIGQKIIKRQATIATQSYLNNEELGKILVPIPPKDIQVQIIEMMDDAYASQKQKEGEAERLLDSIDEYLLGELGIKLPKQEENTIENRIFTRNLSQISGGRFDSFFYKPHFIKLAKSLNNQIYETRELRNLSPFIESGSRPSGGVAHIADGVLSFGGEHVNTQCEIEVVAPKYIPADFHKKHLRTMTKIEDILLVKDGATTGKIGIIMDKNHENQNINEHVFLIRFEAELNPYYFVNLLNTKIYQSLLKRYITGATVTGLTRDAVLSFQIPLPPKEKQTEIADHIGKIRAQAKQLQNEAKAELAQAKKEVEAIILGE